MTDQIPTGIADDSPALAFRFSALELQYLLSLQPGVAATTSASVLGIQPVEDGTDPLLVGGAELLARELLIATGDEFAVAGAAFDTVHILTSATRWSVIKGATADTAAMSVFVECPEGNLLAEPGVLGTWTILLLDESVAPAEVLVGTATNLAFVASESAVLTQTITEVEDRTFSIQRREDNWAYAYGPSAAAEPESSAELSGQEATLLELASFIAYFPRMR